MKVDPITLAVIKSALDSIVDEMAYAVIRTARSEIIKDVMDYSAALCDADGMLIAQAKTIAQHLGAVPDAMQSVLREFGGDLHPGDVVVMNDPYEGGMHIPDVFLFLPIFVDDALEAFAVVIGHQTDMGGRVPGSNASDSTEPAIAHGPTTEFPLSGPDENPPRATPPTQMDRGRRFSLTAC